MKQSPIFNRKSPIPNRYCGKFWSFYTMAVEKLQAEIRASRGKNEMNRLRAAGKIPAVFYGPHLETLTISLDKVLFENALAKKHNLYSLDISGKGEFEVILREVQRDPVTEKIQHVDMIGITRGQKITLAVPVKIAGIPVGVRTSGGILEVLKRHLNITCLPKDMPEFLEVDVTNIEIGESLHVSNIHYDNIIIDHDPKTAIATVVPPTVTKTTVEAAAEAAPAEGEEGAAAEAGKDKKAEGGEEKKAEGGKEKKPKGGKE